MSAPSHTGDVVSVKARVDDQPQAERVQGCWHFPSIVGRCCYVEKEDASFLLISVCATSISHQLL